MRGLMVFAGIALVLTVIACAIANPKKEDKCQLPKMSQQELIKVVVTEFRGRGSDFEPTSENARFDFAEKECDHLVRITFLPERPGGFEIYRISRDGKIVEYIPGH